jgi:hypothetical protein
MRRAFALLPLLFLSCSDPVRDQRVADLGPEDPQGPSPNHRRGQPCLLCHDEKGGEKPLMVVAGTIYQSSDFDAPGAEDVTIQFVDSAGGGPLNDPITVGPSGNFFVTKDEWPDITFPLKVRLAKNNDVVQKMQSTINREGSCNYCHRPNPQGPDYSDQDRELARRSYGQIYVNATVGK